MLLLPQKVSTRIQYNKIKNMEYTSIYLNIANKAIYNDILMAEMAMLLYDGFIETPTGLRASILTKDFNKEALSKLINKYQSLTSIEISKIENEAIKNWNEVWESNFQPLVVENQILVYAPFHKVEKKYPYQIQIEPQMAFGTGHHETTYLMLQKLLHTNCTGKSVLDFGCGTGILAMMTALKGATNILAIDIDKWAYRNIQENIAINNMPFIRCKLGGQEQLDETKYDIVIANITSNVIKENLNALIQALTPKNGLLLLSGILQHQLNEVKNAVLNHGLTHTETRQKGKWCFMSFEQ